MTDKTIHYPNGGKYNYKGHDRRTHTGQAMSLGRNGYIKTIGVNVLAAGAGPGDSIVRLTPINSRGVATRCHIEIPCDAASLRAIAAKLLEIADEAVVQAWRD